MSQPYTFPTPDEVQVGKPNVFVFPQLAVTLYNQEHNDDIQQFNQAVKEWFIQKAYQVGWSNADAADTGILLKATVIVIPHETYPHDSYRPASSR